MKRRWKGCEGGRKKRSISEPSANLPGCNGKGKAGKGEKVEGWQRRLTEFLKAGSIHLVVCRVPIGTHQWLLIITALRHERCCSRSVATPFMACTVLFVSHPFGVIYRSPTKKGLIVGRWLNELHEEVSDCGDGG